MVGVAFGLMFVGFGGGILSSDEALADPETTNILLVLAGLIVLMGVAFMVAAFRSMIACVRIGCERVIVRSTWRTKRFRLPEVRKFSLGSTTGAAPILSFCCIGLELEDGNALVLTESRTLSRRRADDAIVQANALLNQRKAGERREL
jgi:hypothetical protein